MKDFGFWVRLIAIGQLFGLVLVNYGEGWLSPDNPIFMRNTGNSASVEQTEADKSDAPTVTAAPGAVEDGAADNLLLNDGWGGADIPGAGWGGIDDSVNGPEEEFDEAEAPEETPDEFLPVEEEQADAADWGIALAS